MPRSVLTTGFVCGLLAVVAAGGCHRMPAPGGAQGSKPEAARKQAESLAVSAATGAATRQAELLAAAGIYFDRQGRATTSVSVKAPPELPPAPGAPSDSTSPPGPSVSTKKGFNPRPGSPPIIAEPVVSSIPSANEVEADEDALAAARDLIERKLLELDPPVRYRPSINEVKTEFVRTDSRVFVLLKNANEKDFPGAATLREELAKRYSPDEVARLGYVKYQVEITAAQIRELRTRDRLSVVLRVFGAVSFAALAGFLFFRADEWTKGYLTRWLAFGAVLLAGGAAAALYFV